MMIKVKSFADGFEASLDVDDKVNRWLAKHPDYIVKDTKLSANVVHRDLSDKSYLICVAMVIYQEYENV